MFARPLGQDAMHLVQILCKNNILVFAVYVVLPSIFHSGGQAELVDRGSWGHLVSAQDHVLWDFEGCYSSHSIEGCTHQAVVRGSCCGSSSTLETTSWNFASYIRHGCHGHAI